ncbi:MAG: glycosyltransferase family 9 protein [Candidatus Didemnitutus sp.]|nr:glycosyltransferase family 9 protein [Candidatus Didemnitutus sp.]
MQPTAAPRRLCLVRLSALGDVVLATALVQTLRKNFPAAQLTWITSGMTRELLLGLEGVEFITVPRPMKLGDYLALRRTLRGRDFDVLLAAQASFRANLVHACVPARRKIGFDARRARDLHGWFVGERVPPCDEHLAEGFLAFAGALGVAPENYVRSLTLPLGSMDTTAAHALVGYGRYFVINPAASKPERNWRAEHYAAVAMHVARATGWRIVLTGGAGSAEKALTDAVSAQLKDMPLPPLNLAGRTSVRTLAAVLAGAEGLLAPDTGPVHLAAAVGTPVVGLYAVARSALTGPWPERRFCVDRYADAARQFLGTAEPGWHQRVHDARAMDLITVEEVCAQVDRLIAERRGR